MKKRTAAEVRAAKAVVDREEAIAEERERRASERERREARQRELEDAEAAKRRAEKVRTTVTAAGKVATDAARNLVKDVLLPVFAFGVIALAFGYVMLSLNGYDTLVGIVTGVEGAFPSLKGEAICVRAIRPGRDGVVPKGCISIPWSIVLLVVLVIVAIWFAPRLFRAIARRLRAVSDR